MEYFRFNVENIRYCEWISVTLYLLFSCLHTSGIDIFKFCRPIASPINDIDVFLDEYSINILVNNRKSCNHFCLRPESAQRNPGIVRNTSQ